MRTPADAAGTAQVVLDDVAVAGVQLGRGQLDASGKDGAFRAELALPEQQLRATGSARIEPAGTLAAEAAMPAVDLAPFLRGLAPDAAELGGTLAARATARVPLADPGRGEGLALARSGAPRGGERELGEPRPHPGALGARRVLARAVPARRQGRDRLRRGDDRGGRTARRQGHRQAVPGHAGRHPAGDPRDRRRAGSLAARVRRPRLADVRRRRGDPPRQPPAARSAGDAARCRGALRSVEPGPPAQGGHRLARRRAAWRRAAPSPFAAGSRAATGRRSRPGTSRRARSRDSRAPGTPTSS